MNALCARYRVAPLVACVGLAGCFPYHYVERPGFHGTVIDASTRAPVVEAKAALSMDNSKFRAVEAAVWTDERGAFQFPEQRSWGIYIVPMDLLGYSGSIVVQAAGYKSASRHVFWDPRGWGDNDLGAILLERTP